MLRFLPSLVASIRVKGVERASGEAAIDPTLEVADSNGLYIDLFRRTPSFLLIS